MAKVKFYRGKLQSYKNKWEECGHDLETFKYTNCIYFAYDAGALYLDGSLYGINNSENLNKAFTSVEYTPASENVPARIAFIPKDETLNPTYVYLPSVKTTTESITVKTITSEMTTEYQIGLNLQSILGDIGLDLQYNRQSKSLRLVDKDDNVIGSSIPVEDFTEDHFIDLIEHVRLSNNEIPGYEAGQYLHIVFKSGKWNGEAYDESTTKDVYINLSQISNYTKGKGIYIDEDNKISLDLSPDGETSQYLDFNEDNQLKVVGINKALDDVSLWQSNRTDEKIAELKDTVNNYTINDVSISLSPTLDSTHIKVNYRGIVSDEVFTDDYIYNPVDASQYTGNLKQGDTLSVAFIKIQNRLKDIVDTDVSAMADRIESTFSNVIGKDRINLTDASNPTFITREGSHYLDGRTSLSDEIAALDQALFDSSVSYDDSTGLPHQVVTRVNQKDNKIEVIHKTLGDVSLGGVANGGDGGILSDDTIAEAFGKTNTTILWHFD